MNALMMIDVRVRSAAALAQLRGLEVASTRAAGGVGAVGQRAQWGLPIISKWGNQVQWAGRQLMYNFTLPLGVAAVAASKWALDNEKAMVRVAKVYGDNSKVFQNLSKKELPALGKAFEALSNQFGVARSDVINIAADWAAAGASGVALAKSVKLTLQTMILGEIDAAVATKQLIAIQAQYGASVEDLAHTIDVLNMVENQTGATMKDLMDGMSRAAGVARVAGVDVEHLSAMMAALVPATGSAATAGNALKTIISRLIAPTQDAVDLLGRIGINVADVGWQSLSAADRIEILAKRYDGLSSAAKANLASVIGSRWQFNRLVVLLEDVNRQHGYYRKSLQATTDQEKLLAQKQKELNQVLESNPQRLKQAWVILQNALANVVTPLLPALVELARKVGDVGHWFQNLSGATQKWVLTGLIALALVGPLARYIGALTNLVGLLSGAFHFLAVSIPIALIKLATFTLWIGKLAMMPFQAIFAGLVLIGEGGLAMGKFFIKGLAIMFGAPLQKIAVMAAYGFWRFMTAAWVAGQAAMFAVQRALMPVLLGIWASFRAELLVLWATLSIGWELVVLGFQTSFAAGMAGLQMLARAAYVQLLAVTRAFGVAWAVTIELATATGTAIWQVMTITWTLLWRRLMLNLLLFPIFFGKALLASRAIFMGFGSMVIGLWRGLWMGVARLAPLALAALTSPWTWAILAIFVVLSAFHDKINTFFKNMIEGIGNAFNSLPRAVANALTATIQIVAAAAKQIYEWLSYLNPFARHSPSIVDQVIAGNAVIRNEYARTAAAVARHKQIVTKADIGAQEKVVARWKAALDAANEVLDIQESRLSRIKDRLDALTDAYNKHQQAMQNFAQAPLVGMQAMSNAIFDNQMAQKKLQLQMLQWEQVNGSLDDAANKLASIAGELESLKSEASSLRLAGAGSDVLGPINDQISSLETAANQLRDATQNSPLADMQKQLDALQTQGQILDLENSINFDPLVRQLDQLANSQKEISFQDAVDGIKREQAAMAALQPKIDVLTAAYDKQQAIVQKAKDARDQIADRYDKEREKLAALKKAYDALHGAMASATLDKGKGLGFAAASFEASKAGNFPTPGGDKKIGREGGLKDQSKLIDQFTQQTLDQMGSIWGGFDMFGPLKKKWQEAVKWLKDNTPQGIKDFVAGLKANLTAVLSGAGIGATIGMMIGGPAGAVVGGLIGAALGPSLKKAFDGGKVKAAVEDAFSAIYNFIAPIIEKIISVVKLLEPDFKRIWDGIVNGAKRIWNDVGPHLVKMFQALWPIIKFVAIVVGVVLVGAFKVAASILGHVFGPVVDTIISVLDGLVVFITGIADLIVGIFTLDFGKMKDGVVEIFSGLWEAIWGILSGAGRTLWGIIEGIVGGVVSFFQWLYDQLVGHSIIPDLVNGILYYFGLLAVIPKWIWNHVLSPAVDKIKDFWNKFVAPFLATIWDLWKAEWNGLKAIATWLWDNVLNPALGKIKSFWTNYVSPFLGGIFTAWKTVWTSLTGMGQWVYDKVMQPIIDKIKEGWGAIKQWLTDNKDMLLKPIKGIVNVVIDAVNALIGGLNLVSKALPGISFHIDAIPRFAQGGPLPSRRVGSGFVTQGARAIVGEGKANYPEYVIPTDPTYRQRAAALLASAAQRMNLGISVDPTRQGVFGDTVGDMNRVLAANPTAGAGAVPAFGIGGLIPGPIKDAANKIKSIGEWATNPQAVASTIMKPAFAVAKALVRTVSYDPAKGLGLAGIDIAQSWAKGVDTVYGKKIADLNAQFGGASGASWNGTLSADARIARAQKWAQSQVGKPYIWGGVGPDGYDCSGFMSAITNVIRGQSPHSRDGSTANFPWGGFINGVAPNGFTIGSTNNYGGSGVGHMAGTLAGMNVESRGGRGVVIGSAARGYGDSGFTTRAHIQGLMNGAVIRARMGGTVFRGGEGSNDEAIVPLPKQWRQSIQSAASGDTKTTHIHIHGDLSFPNINNADDVQKFIKNLEILAKD